MQHIFSFFISEVIKEAAVTLLTKTDLSSYSHSQDTSSFCQVESELV